MLLPIDSAMTLRLTQNPPETSSARAAGSLATSAHNFKYKSQSDQATTPKTTDNQKIFLARGNQGGVEKALMNNGSKVRREKLREY